MMPARSCKRRPNVVKRLAAGLCGAAWLAAGHAQAVAEAPVPAALKRLLGPGETLLASQFADLNGDGLQDVVFVVEPRQLRDDDEGVRTLKIAIGAADGSLKVVKENRKLVFCRQCGGVFGDPFESLAASNKSFTVQHYGGSSWRWTNAFTFNYSRKDETWQLVKVEEGSFHASEPDKQTSKTYRPPKHFGKIDISEFDPANFKGVGKK